MKNSKGQIIASTTALFVITIIIILILILFTLGSGVIRKIDKSGGGLKVYDLEDIGLNNLRIYMENYKSLLIKNFEDKKNG